MKNAQYVMQIVAVSIKVILSDTYFISNTVL